MLEDNKRASEGLWITKFSDGLTWPEESTIYPESERSTAMTAIDKQEFKKIVAQMLDDYDGMWFYHSMQEWGIEKTNKIK